MLAVAQFAGEKGVEFVGIEHISCAERGGSWYGLSPWLSWCQLGRGHRWFFGLSHQTQWSGGTLGFGSGLLRCIGFGRLGVYERDQRRVRAGLMGPAEHRGRKSLQCGANAFHIVQLRTTIDHEDCATGGLGGSAGARERDVRVIGIDQSHALVG